MDNIAICDDVAVDRERLKLYISNNNVDRDNITIYEYDSGEALLAAMQDIRFSVVFLDLQLKGLCGYDTATKLRKIDDSLILAFYTGTADPSPQSFETVPYRYIMKKFSDKEIENYINAVISEMVKVRKIPLVEVKAGRKKIIIKVDHIVYIEKSKKGLLVHLSESVKKQLKIKDSTQIYSSDKLENFYEKYKQYGFGYPHSSYVINFRYLSSSTKENFSLKDLDTTFSITRTKIHEFDIQNQKFMLSQYEEGK